MSGEKTFIFILAKEIILAKEVFLLEMDGVKLIRGVFKNMSDNIINKPLSLASIDRWAAF